MTDTVGYSPNLIGARSNGLGQYVRVDDSNNLKVASDSFTDGNQLTKITDGAGVVNTKTVGTAVVAGDVGLIAHAMIHGLTTGGGGGYVDVKVNPSGALTVEANVSDNIVLDYVNDPALSVGHGRNPLISETMCVSKFGAAPSGAQTSLTDIWDRSDATPTQQIWLAPTAARVHSIVSTSASDTTGGTGAISVTIYGLQTWSSAETSETVVLTGLTPVNTVNSYVIIHRMRANAQSTTTNVGVNVGTITATAAVNSTVTAVILAGNGQTEMAIYGVPSGKTFYLTRWGANIDRTTVATTCDLELRVNPNPDVQTVAFQRKEDISLSTVATNIFEKNYKCYPKFAGPCIIKVQGIASSNDLDTESSFDGFLVNN